MLLGHYGLFMVSIGLMQFPTCPQEAILLQQGPSPMYAALALSTNQRLLLMRFYVPQKIKLGPIMLAKYLELRKNNSKTSYDISLMAQPEAQNGLNQLRSRHN